MLAALVLPFLTTASAQVTATGTNGVTNPPAPSFYPVGSTVDESSMSRLATLNSVDDFCLYAPESYGDTIGDDEATVVAYCTKPRNNARLIPDGTIQSAHVSSRDAAGRNACLTRFCSSSRPTHMSRFTVFGTAPRSTS